MAEAEAEAEAEAMIIDEGDKKKQLKRKRSNSGSSAEPLLNLSSQEKSAKISSFREELKGLYDFYRELAVGKGSGNFLGDVLDGSGKINFSLDSVIALLLEESGLPLGKLVNEIFEKINGKFGNDGGGINGSATVKTKVLTNAQRKHYGIMNLDADILEDDSEATLWCWEANDLKWFPKPMRDMLRIRRTCRKKIHERISAVTAMITALEELNSHPKCGPELAKASMRLSKILGVADIRVIIDMAERTGDEVDEKGGKRDDKLLVKQLEKNKRETEKERRKMEREQQKEKLQNEKELKRLQDEAEKEERRRQKEESEKRKLLRRQQEEAEKEQRRKEKEEAEMKKQLSLQKQASLMERFLKKAKTSSAAKNEQSPTHVKSDSCLKSDKEKPEPVTLEMDSILSTNYGTKAEELWKLHLSSWRLLGHSIRSNRNMRWGIRQKPKSDIVKELKLTTNRDLARDDDMNIEKLVDGWVDSSVDSAFCQTNTRSVIPINTERTQSKQLLQFDKSYRPAFYGVWPKKSQVINAHHPFAKDPELDYEIDSDEEWEEEEPGESLSDFDKDGEDESMDEGCSKGEDDEESEDGFMVPDGYLSENEGVEVDKVNSCQLVEEEPRSPMSKDTQLSQDIVLLRQQKYLRSLTEHALRKNQPLIISNLMHEKASLLFADNLTGVNKLEQTCLQALSICVFPCGVPVEISITNDAEEENLEACMSNSNASTTNLSSRAAISESDLPSIVSVIQSCSNGINKLVESLQEKLPSFSKSQLRNKVREISDFTDNRWQVKKEVLVKLGLTVTPEKGVRRTKKIASFFSKRCLPPSDKSNCPAESSPQSSQKPVTTTQTQQDSAV